MEGPAWFGYQWAASRSFVGLFPMPVSEPKARVQAGWRMAVESSCVFRFFMAVVVVCVVANWFSMPRDPYCRVTGCFWCRNWRGLCNTWAFLRTHNAQGTAYDDWHWYNGFWLRPWALCQLSNPTRSALSTLSIVTQRPA